MKSVFICICQGGVILTCFYSLVSGLLWHLLLSIFSGMSDLYLCLMFSTVTFSLPSILSCLSYTLGSGPLWTTSMCFFVLGFQLDLVQLDLGIGNRRWKPGIQIQAICHDSWQAAFAIELFYPCISNCSILRFFSQERRGRVC